jgi:uncharacterized protein YqeY
MNLLDYLREELVRLMKRREKVALRAVRDAISAIQNAETSYVAAPATVAPASEFVAGGVQFGHAERVVQALTDEQMMSLARGEVARRLDEAVRMRDLGEVDRALMLKAEALALGDRLDAYAA